MEFDVFINTILNNDYYSNKKRGYWTELIHSIREAFVIQMRQNLGIFPNLSDPPPPPLFWEISEIWEIEDIFYPPPFWEIFEIFKISFSGSMDHETHLA